MNRLATLALAATLLSGCAGQSGFQTPQQKASSENANVFPANYKSDLLAFLRTYLNDPSHIRDASVSEPAIRPIGGVNIYANCVRFNARKSGGDYAGSKDHIALYISGRLDRFIPVSREQRELCADAAYKPFPELERLSR